MNKVIPLSILVLFAFGLAGCNTTRGLGQDIEATGEKIEEVAEETKERIEND